MQHSWALHQMAVERCWQRGFTGRGVRVGHLDTGVDIHHPALSNKVAAYRIFDGDGMPLMEEGLSDTGRHGTCTASLICGDQVGVAADARLCAGVVVDGGKSIVRVLYGLEWLIDQGIRVLALPLGLPGYNPIFTVILRRLREAGVLVVAPVGNTGKDRTCSPGNYPDLLAVGSIDITGSIPKSSGSQNFERERSPFKPDFVAPGVRVVCAQKGGGYVEQSGTSMASAYVAGIAALLFQAYPQAAVDQVETALRQSCQFHPDPIRAGVGCVNAYRALECLEALNP
jgi:subtilisin